MSTREHQKYPVVLRRDGTVPEWDWFVLGQRDPAATVALEAYAAACENFGYDPEYVSRVRDMADEWARQAMTTPDDARHPPAGSDPSTDRVDPRVIEPTVAALARAPSLGRFLTEAFIEARHPGRKP